MRTFLLSKITFFFMDRKYGIGIGLLLIVLSIGMLGGFVVFADQGSVLGDGSNVDDGCAFSKVVVDGQTFSSYQDFKQSAVDSGISASEFDEANSDVEFKVIDGELYDKNPSGVCESGSSE